ncbi:MAG TPA: hypothetical protein VKX17_22510 [Planctomycetota bacterium]|nr:hypothetical protein [Planctomycetota bacterium]
MKRTATHTEPEHVRHKLADAYRLESTKTRWKKNERVTFARMADSWQRTLSTNDQK